MGAVHARKREMWFLGDGVTILGDALGAKEVLGDLDLPGAYARSWRGCLGAFPTWASTCS